MELITVHVYPTRIEAEISKGFLAAHGIKSYIMADDAGGMRPYPMSYTFGVELKVPEQDINEAKTLLESIEEKEDQDEN